MTEKDIIHKLTYLLHGHRRKIFIIFGCLLISTGLNLCIPFISKEIMDEGFIGGNKNILLYLVVGSFAIYMLISALNIIKEKVRVEIVAKVQYSLWHQAYEHLMRMKINYFDDRNAAEIFNNLSVDIANMVSVADESAFCCDTGIQHGWRGYWSFYIGLPYDDFSIAVYSNQGCCYEIFCKIP